MSSIVASEYSVFECYLRRNLSILCSAGVLSVGVEECISVCRGGVSEESRVGGCRGGVSEESRVGGCSSGILLPFCSVMEGLCEGIKKNHSLYTQCGKEVVGGTVLCKGCTRQKENSSTGSTPYGMIRDRAKMGPNYIDPKGNKAVPYANVAKRLGINISDAKKEAEELINKALPDDSDANN